MESRQITISEIEVDDLVQYNSPSQCLTTTIPEDDVVNHPNHYTQGGIECIDAIDAATVGLTGSEAVNTGNVIKYMWRWKFKNGLQDLFKTMWYLIRLCWQIDKEKTIQQLEKLLAEYKGRS